MKLKIDVQQSTIDGLKSEIKHQSLELKETKDLLKIYEDKCEDLIKQITSINSELNLNKRQMIGYTQTQEEREEKIQSLKQQLAETKLKSDEYHLALGTLQIHHEKLLEQFSNVQTTYDDTVDKLHKMNKARHDLETKMTDEIERNRALQDIVRLKEDIIMKRQNEIEDLDRRVIDLERNIESLEIKKQSVERQFDLSKKQLGDQIFSTQEQLKAEKETRDMWIDRFEKEQKEHSKTQQDLMQVKSDLKDQLLNVKSTEIKLISSSRQIQLLQEQSVKFQHQINESLSKAEGLDRELTTQKEIMRQVDMSKKEYIDKLKKELETVEQKWQWILN